MNLEKVIDKIQKSEELTDSEIILIVKNATTEHVEEIVEIIKAEGLKRDSNTTQRSKTWNKLGLTLHGAGRSSLAKTIFEGVITAGSTNAATQNNYAKVLIDTSELIKGKEFLIKAYNQDISRPEFVLLPAYVNLSKAMIKDAKKFINLGDRINALTFAWLSIESSLRRQWIKFVMKAIPTIQPSSPDPLLKIREELADWNIKNISDFLVNETKTINSKLAGDIKSARRYRNALFHLTGDRQVPTKGEIETFIKLAEKLWQQTL